MIARFLEPSTYAGLAALLQGAAAFVPGSAAGVLQAASGVCAALAVALRERGAP